MQFKIPFFFPFLSFHSDKKFFNLIKTTIFKLYKYQTTGRFFVNIEYSFIGLATRFLQNQIQCKKIVAQGSVSAHFIAFELVLFSNKKIEANDHFV